MHTAFVGELSPIFPKEEVASFFQILATHYLHLNRAQLTLAKQEPLDKHLAGIFIEALERLKKQEPIQYILGQTEFYGLTLKVTPATLIPTPETEELVDWIVNDFKNKQPASIIDLCTGSGCIALALAKTLANAKVTAVDLSGAAIQVAQQNAKAHQLAVQFKVEDVLNPMSHGTLYDVIVANPPYVRDLEKSKMATNVLAYEPKQALFVSNQDPLVFYKAIGSFAQKHLNTAGALYLEINEYLSKEMVLLMRSLGFNQIEVRQDIFGKDRMIKCW